MQDNERLRTLAAYLTIPDIGAPALDTANLGDPSGWPDGWPAVIQCLQAGIEPVLSPAQQADLFATDPDSAQRPPERQTWADVGAILGPLAWEWQSWLPSAMLTLIVGASETGKSALALRIAACYLRGDPWPDGTPFTGQTGKVLWAEAESGQALNLDRAKKWGLPLDSLVCPLRDGLSDVALEDPDHQTAITAQALAPDVRLIVVDSLSGGNRRDENSSDMLAPLRWLAALAKETGKPVILCHHLRKKGKLDGDGVALDRVRGSSAIVQLPRVCWALDKPDPLQPVHVRLGVIKSNLAAKPRALGFSIGDGGVTFTAAPEPPRHETLQDKASDLLLALLRKGPRRGTELREECEQAGLSWDAAKRASKTLGIVVARKTDAATKRPAWFWSLPSKELGI